MRTGSFAAAGRELGYTASAVSQQMSALERSLGLQLFEREVRRVRPTPAAAYLCERAEELVGLVTQLDCDIARLAAGQVGNLRIGSFSSAGAALLSPAIARFLIRRREVQISLDEGEPHDLFPRLAAGDLDVALGFAYDLVPASWPDELTVTELVTEPVHVIASVHHRLAAQEQIAFADLSAETWVANREETAAHACLLRRAAQAGFEPDIAFRTNSFEAVRGLVRHRLGVGLVPDLGYVQDRELTVLSVADGLPQRRVVAANRRLHRSPLVKGFIDALGHVADRRQQTPTAIAL